MCLPKIYIIRRAEKISFFKYICKQIQKIPKNNVLSNGKWCLNWWDISTLIKHVLIVSLTLATLLFERCIQYYRIRLCNTSLFILLFEISLPIAYYWIHTKIWSIAIYLKKENYFKRELNGRKNSAKKRCY